MSDNKHNENWVDFYKAALLEEDPEKLLQRRDIAVDALRSRIWVLVGELHGEHNGHSTVSGEWKALHDALRTLAALRDRPAALVLCGSEIPNRPS